MLYVGSLLAGVINGLFASGAGQILVFMYIYILNVDTHKSRATSIFSIGIVTLVSITRYISFMNYKLFDVITVVLCGLIFGLIGSKIMKKINPNFLNLLSGVVITVFSIYSIVRG